MKPLGQTLRFPSVLGYIPLKFLGAPPKWFFDKFPKPDRSFSLRKLGDNHQTAVTVKNLSTGNTVDIGFDINGDFDESALDGFFSGSDTVKVPTIFDATDNPVHFTHTVDSELPTIVDNGTKIKVNGKMAVEFDGSNDKLFAGAGFVTASGDSPFSCFFVIKFESIKSSKVNYLWEIGQDVNRVIDARVYVSGVEPPNSADTIRLRGGNALFTRQWGTTNSNVATTIYTGGGAPYDYWFNSSKISRTSVNTAQHNWQNSGQDSKAVLGRERGTAYSNFRFQEIHFYWSDQTGSRFDLEANMDNYWRQ